MVKLMQRPLWEMQAIPGNLVVSPTPDLTKEIFYNELFKDTKNGMKPKRLIDTEGYIITARDRDFKHIFMKDGIFQADRAERIYLIKETIIKARYIITDKDDGKRFHLLQPYRISGQVESFCVITERAAKIGRIVTAFPIEWERVYALLQQK
jgi:hypothetical protein